MPLDITYLGHSGFLFGDGEHTLVVDPFLTDNPKARHRPDDIDCQFIALTHGHFDHVGDSIAIAKRNDANVIAAFELTALFEDEGHANTNPGNPGGRIETAFGWVAFTQAFHSSSYQGRYTGMPCGLVLRMGGVTVYHLGDTGIFGDLALLGEIYSPDVACVPIGDRFTMGPELATRAVEMIRPKVAIPIHYDTWPPIEQDPSELRPAGVEVKVLEPGESWSYG